MTERTAQIINFPPLLDRPGRKPPEFDGSETATIMILPIVRIERPDPAPAKPKRKRKKTIRIDEG